MPSYFWCIKLDYVILLWNMMLKVTVVHLCIDPGRLKMKRWRFRGEGASAIRAGSAAIPNLDRTIQTSSGMHAWIEASPLLDVTSTGSAGSSAFYFLRAYTAAALGGINGHPCVHVCSSRLPPLSQSLPNHKSCKLNHKSIEIKTRDS